MKSNRFRSLFNYLKWLAIQLAGLQLTNAFKAVLAESRLKKFLPQDQHAAPETAAKISEQPTAENPAAATVLPAENKSLRWKEYLGKGGKWNYERWSNTYNDNMKRALQANIAVNQYHHEIGWGMREVTIEVNGKPVRLPIADIDTMRGIEVKSGKYCFRSRAVMNKIAKHEGLVKKGWDITWKIEGIASLPLLKELKNAGININY